MAIMKSSYYPDYAEEDGHGICDRCGLPIGPMGTVQEWWHSEHPMDLHLHCYEEVKAERNKLL